MSGSYICSISHRSSGSEFSRISHITIVYFSRNRRYLYVMQKKRVHALYAYYDNTIILEVWESGW
ncbi:MAG: hypothetical protein K2K09_06430, partial [Lachnospiraceae bacterium]|nr:hypothetical protein [Lachnospiraceae bacterium]